MFGEDRFGPQENYYHWYAAQGGKLSESQVNGIISAAYLYLDEKYPLQKYRESFPSVISAIRATCSVQLSNFEEGLLVETFAAHEIGEIDAEHTKAIQKLSEHFLVGAVIDIWAPKTKWVMLFREVGLEQIFSSLSFSSDHGIVKPSPKPFLMVLGSLGVYASDAIFVGDSIRRDLGGANAAGIDCILVGGAEHPSAHSSASSLLELVGG